MQVELCVVKKNNFFCTSNKYSGFYVILPSVTGKSFFCKGAKYLAPVTKISPRRENQVIRYRQKHNHNPDKNITSI